MTEKKDWKDSISEDKLVALINNIFYEKYKLRMTKRARSHLRRALTLEFQTMADDLNYESIPKSPEETALKFAQLAAGELELAHSADVSPKPSNNTLQRYEKVGVVATLETVEKAKAYHKKTNVCPVWPFC